MSGIVGIVNLDGAPLDRGLLQALTADLAFRGPDAQDIWADGSAGFGHTLLRTTFESEHEHQPSSLDGQIWITADARIDGQAELIDQLQSRGRTVTPGAADAELILHAYHAWGERCLDHLIGDFAFAIWDDPQQKLFCARDHFGVKPFFYAHVKNVLVFSNTLECVRKHPAVTSTLDDLWIADFLLFESSLDPAATVYADIRRLPPAHSLTWCRATGLDIRCYWSLPTDLGIRHRPAGDYVEHFKELLRKAVSDRLRTDRVGIELSGGMDSSTVAAFAKEVLSRRSTPFELHAHTIVYDRLIPDEERHYAGAVAKELGIPIHVLPGDDYKLYDCERTSPERWPEPANAPEFALYEDLRKQVASFSRVVLTGWDGDALLNESPLTYLRALLRRRRHGRLLAEAAQLLRLRPMQVAHGLLKRIRKTRSSISSASSYPAWISSDLEKRLGLKQRWEQYQRQPSAAHPLRPYAYRAYGHIQHLSSFFDSFDSGVSGRHLEYRHPLLDLRLIEYCLTLPPLPWCVRKEMLRAATQRMLPAAVLGRPKSPLGGFPYVERLQTADAQWIDSFTAPSKLERYVIRTRVPPVWKMRHPAETWMNLRPLGLSIWLNQFNITNQ